MDSLAADPSKVNCCACGLSGTLSLRIWICEETETCPNYYLCEMCYVNNPNAHYLRIYPNHTADHVFRQHVYSYVGCDCCKSRCTTADRRWRCQVCCTDLCEVCYGELWYFNHRATAGLVPQHSIDHHHSTSAVEPIRDPGGYYVSYSEWSMHLNQDGHVLLKKKPLAELLDHSIKVNEVLQHRGKGAAQISHEKVRPEILHITGNEEYFTKNSPGRTVKNMLEFCKAILSIDGTDIDNLTKKMDELCTLKSPEEMQRKDVYIVMTVSMVPLAHNECIVLTRGGVARQIFNKLHGVSLSQFTQKQLEGFLTKALNLAEIMKEKGQSDSAEWQSNSAESVIKEGEAFASNVEDNEVRILLLDKAREELYMLYKDAQQYSKAAETDYFQSINRTILAELLRSGKLNEALELLDNCTAATSNKEENCSSSSSTENSQPEESAPKTSWNRALEYASSWLSVPKKDSRSRGVVTIYYKDLEAGVSSGVAPIQFDEIQHQTFNDMLEFCKAILSVDGTNIDELTKKMEKLCEMKSPEEIYPPLKVSGLPLAHGQVISLTRMWVVQQIFKKLDKEPCIDFTQKQLEELLTRVVYVWHVMKVKGQLEFAEVVLRLGTAFASKVQDHVLEIRLLILTADTLSRARDHERGLKMIKEAFSAIGVDDDGDRKIEAYLKFTEGRISYRALQKAEAIKAMEEARDLCLRSNYNFDDDLLNSYFCELFQYYTETSNIEAGLSFMEIMKPVLAKVEGERDSFGQNWNFIQGLFLYQCHEHRRAQNCWSEEFTKGLKRLGSDDDDDDDDDDYDDDEDEESEGIKTASTYLRHYCGEHIDDPRYQCNWLFQIARLQLGADEEAALSVVKAAEEVVNSRLGGQLSYLADIEVLRGDIYSFHKNYTKAFEAYEKAVEFLKRIYQNPLLHKTGSLVYAHLSQCFAKLSELASYVSNCNAGTHANLTPLALINEAGALFEMRSKPWYYYCLAKAQVREGYYREAWAFARRAMAHLIVDDEPKNLHTPLSEKIWINVFKESLLRYLRLNEMLSLILGGYRSSLKALILAEQCRMRLYMRTTEGMERSKDFDCNDNLGETILRDVVFMCGGETAIIFYSYDGPADCLRCYLIHGMPDQREIMVFCSGKVEFKDHLAKWVREGSGEKTFTSLVNETLISLSKNEIKNITMDTDNRLSILHSILIKPIEQRLQESGCKNLVICPEGILSKFPFGALYNNDKKLFLIQQMTVCVTPSIRALHYCFKRQAEFEMGWEKLESPFVAGNPEPMGAGQESLPGAAEEAKTLVKIFKNDGVQDFSGDKMTKANVLNHGFKRSQVVVLSTHCMKTSVFPQGAIVLRQESNKSDETLTPNEIVANGTIPAGLVVLSACDTGLGEVTDTEGVLGPGRAVLQSGAASVILTLWKVDDDTTTSIITGMFENLQKGWTVPQSLQARMKDMIEREKKEIYEWAPVFAMGSPQLRLPKYFSELFQFISTPTKSGFRSTIPDQNDDEQDLSESSPEFIARSTFRRYEEERRTAGEQNHLQSKLRISCCVPEPSGD